MLTEKAIRACGAEDELFTLLSDELCRRLPDGEGDDLDRFVQKLRTLPRGLRAMASIYQLDVSMALDDLGWHFANWHHHPYCRETLHGLTELEARREAEIFAAAYDIVQPYWTRIGRLIRRDFHAFVRWYNQSLLETALMPLNEELWAICGQTRGLLSHWTRYARAYPARVVAEFDITPPAGPAWKPR